MCSMHAVDPAEAKPTDRVGVNVQTLVSEGSLGLDVGSSRISWRDTRLPLWRPWIWTKRLEPLLDFQKPLQCLHT